MSTTKNHYVVFLARMSGFEPPSPSWQPGIISFILHPQKLAHPRGIEPRPVGLEATVLPLYDRRIKKPHRRCEVA
jgi:hypothetical protein